MLKDPAGQLVYCLQAGKCGPFKIGRGDAERRRAELQTGNPSHLVVRRLIHTKDAIGLERQLHARFADARIRGEWFDPTPEVAGFCRGNVGTASNDIQMAWEAGLAEGRLRAQAELDAARERASRWQTAWANERRRLQRYEPELDAEQQRALVNKAFEPLGPHK